MSMTPTTEEAKTKGQEEPVAILYTNWRHETGPRIIIPGGDDPESPNPWFGATEWHSEPQYLLSAWDVGKGAYRDFALAGIKAWGQAAVDAALAAPRADSAERTAGEDDDWAGTLARSVLHREGYAYAHLVNAVAKELRRIDAVGYTKGHEAGDAHRKAATPAPSSPGVPDSVRALAMDRKPLPAFAPSLGPGNTLHVCGKRRPLGRDHNNAGRTLMWLNAKNWATGVMIENGLTRSEADAVWGRWFETAIWPAPDSTRTGQVETEENGWRIVRAVMRRLSAAKNAGGIEDPETSAQVLGAAVDAGVIMCREALAARPADPEAQGAWQDISTAEKKSRPSIIVETEVAAHGRTDKVEFVAHWAEDLSGEEQPPFRGWFYATGYGFAQLPGTPKRWRPLPAPPASSGQESA